MIIIELHFKTISNGCKKQHVIRKAFKNEDVDSVNEFLQEPKEIPDFYERELIIFYPK